MARERFAFLRAVESILKGVRSWVGCILRRGVYRRVLALSFVGLFLAVGMPPVLSQVPALKPTLLAQDSAPSLVQQSQEKYENGDFAGAIELLRQAVRLFEEGESRNRAITLVNLGRIQSELGQQYQACETLTQALGLSSGVCEDEELPENRLEWVSEPLRRPDLVQVNSLRIFGNVLRAIGRLEESQQILEQSVKLVENLSSSKQAEARGAILLSLGNTLRARGNLERDRRASPQYDFIPWDCSNRIILEDASEAVKEPFDNAEQRYQQIIDEYTLSAIKTRAQLNQLSLLLEQGKLNRAKELASTVNERSLSQFPQSRMRVYARINWAKSLACLRQKPPGDEPSWDTIVSQMKTAQREATEIKDKLAQSYVIGSLGGLHEYWVRQKQMPTGENPIQTAQKLTQEALYLVQPAEAPDVAYQWQWQLGRLLDAEGEGKREEAIAYYEAAVKTLESVRGNLLTINSDVQFSLRDNVEPVYRKLVDLLLRRAEAFEDNRQEKEKLLKEVLDVVDSLRLAELENFLRCDLSGQAEGVKQDIEEIDPEAAFIYPIILQDRLKIIFKLPNQSLDIRVSKGITSTKIETTIDEMQKFQSRESGFDDVKGYSHDIYNWLIQPLEEDLNKLSKKSEIKTLVFLLDGSLRNVPMAVLMDKNEEYLIEKYAVAVIPSRNLVELQPRQKQFNTLTAGITEGRNFENFGYFEPLEFVGEELKNIQKVTESANQPLLDERFTDERLEREIDSAAFPIVHIATHGEFNSDPERTFIVAWDKLIKAKNFDEIIQVTNPDKPISIELLVLSACKTAQGDRRAALGLAGVAAQARVRTTVATLWTVNDKATADFMFEFYKNLKQEQTIAEALRQTQLFFLGKSGSEVDYKFPYYWSPFILVGNWLWNADF